MLKKGQVSVFIIVAVAIVFVVLVYLGVNGNLKIDDKVDPEIEPIYDYVQECLHQVGEEGIYYVGQTGGYFGTAEISYQDTIAYYLYDNQNYMPLKENIEKELQSYVNFAMPFCLNHFDNFKDFEISSGEIVSKASIENEKVSFDVDYSLDIRKGDNSYSLKNFKTTVDSRLGTIYDAIEEFMQEQMKKTDGVCLGCMYEISEKYGVYFNILDTEQDNTVMIVVRDEQIGLFNEEYVFYFINKLEKLE